MVDSDSEEDNDLVQLPKKQQKIAPSANFLKTRQPASKVLPALIADQPHVQFSDIQPRNKAGLTKESTDSEVRAALGSVYNAHKIRLFNSSELNQLNKTTTFMVDSDRGCHICTNSEKAEPTTTAKCNARSAAASPRGVDLPRKWRHNNAIVVASYQRTHVMLALHNRMPPTSEHEVSHRCHNPACVNVDHLVWELHPENVAREGCRNLRKVECPCCTHKFAVDCPHNPKCL